MSYLEEQTATDLAEYISNVDEIKPTDNFFYAGFLACLYSLIEDTPENVSEAYLGYYAIAKQKNTENLETGPYISCDLAKAIGYHLATNNRILEASVKSETDLNGFYSGFMAGIYSLAEEKPRPIEDAFLRYFDVAEVARTMKEMVAGHEN